MTKTAMQKRALTKASVKVKPEVKKIEKQIKVAKDKRARQTRAVNERILLLKRKQREAELGRPLRSFRFKAEIDVVLNEEDIWGRDCAEEDFTTDDVHQMIRDDFGDVMTFIDEWGYQDRQFEITEVK